VQLVLPRVQLAPGEEPASRSGNGFLHLTTWQDVIAMVDTRGEAWTIDVPCSRGRQRPFWRWRVSGFVSHSQGGLVYAHVRTRRTGASELEIFVLGERSSERWWWSRKHKVTTAYLFGPGKLRRSWVDDNPVVAFHPTYKRFCFYDRSGKRLMCYDMTRRRVNAIQTLEDVSMVYINFFLYVPFYSRTLDHLTSKCCCYMLL
jgi:hypothetical protein